MQTQAPSFAVPPEALHKSSKVGADAEEELDLDSEEAATEDELSLTWFPQAPVTVLQTAPSSQTSPLQTQAPSFIEPPEALHRSVKVGTYAEEEEVDLDSEEAATEEELFLESEDISEGLLRFPQTPVIVLQTAPTSQSSLLQTQAPSFAVPPEALQSSVKFESSSLPLDEELALLLDDFAELKESFLETGIQFSLWQ